MFSKKLGNPDYFTNDVIYLLRIDNDEKNILHIVSRRQHSFVKRSRCSKVEDLLLHLDNFAQEVNGIYVLLFPLHF